MPYLDRPNFYFLIVLLIINLFFSQEKNTTKIEIFGPFRMGRKRRFFETDDDIENDDDFVPVDENLESNLTGWIKTEAEPRRSSRRKVSKTETKTEPLQSLSEVFDDENKPVRVASRGTSRQYSKKARTTMVRGTVFHLEF